MLPLLVYIYYYYRLSKEAIMKKATVVLALLLLSSIAAHAQTGGGMMGEQKGQDKGMTGEGQQMPMMKHMMGHGMMMQDMMQMMADMMKMQQKIIQGVKPAEKKEMMKELSQMMEKMDKMMADMKGMMSQGMMMQGMMGGTASAGTATEEQKGGQQQAQEKSEAGVTAKVTQEGRDGTLKFTIALETHTVALDTYKLDEIVVLRAGGKEQSGRVVSQEGSGHHRSAVVEFNNPGTKEVEIVIKGVAGVPERVFRFTLQ
jgi:hypothetical protein